MSIRLKTTLLFSGIILLISIITTSYFLYSLSSSQKNEIASFRKDQYAMEAKELQKFIKIAIDICKISNKTGGAEAKQTAFNLIAKIKFSKEGFFFIYKKDMILLADASAQSLIGKNVSNVKTKDGKMIFVVLKNAALKSKSGAVTRYLWPKIGEKSLVGKMAYSQYFAPYDWIIGTGAYTDRIEKEINRKQVILSEQLRNTTLTIAGITVLIILLNIFVINFGFKRLISMPLNDFSKQFNVFLDYINMKTNVYKPAVIKHKDEITIMTSLLNNSASTYDEKLKNDMKVIAEVTLILVKIRHGIYKFDAHTESENPMMVSLVRSINVMTGGLNESMAKIKTTLQSFNDDDFTKRIEIPHDIHEDLLNMFELTNKLGETLSDNAKDNYSNGEELGNNSDIMTKSMHKLSDKANEQAARLEETAAAAEEITSLTRGNTENTSKMSELGGGMKTLVSKGQDLAKKTGFSMEEINEKISSINQATDIIDQIAFQTNILSLNAAVEAATAGEAGKGFAVVAGEVRNLASRSAESALEIKNLVKDAIEKANEGKEISEIMIKEYASLSENTANALALIENINTASKEQMQGIEQINDAISMQDKLTQENANESGKVLNISNKVKDMASTLLNDAKDKKF